jgi:hypothetical protein
LRYHSNEILVKRRIIVSVEAQKLEVIEWILKIRDASTIKKILKLKNTTSVPQRGVKRGVRMFGGGKGIFTYVAEDFDAPLPDFKEYMK